MTAIAPESAPGRGPGAPAHRAPACTPCAATGYRDPAGSWDHRSGASGAAAPAALPGERDPVAGGGTPMTPAAGCAPVRPDPGAAQP
jgi:hypothetical protein